MAETRTYYLTIAEASRLIDSKELSPLELTRAVFERIDATDGAIHSYVRLMRASAAEEASRAEERALSGSRLGPLDGIPVAVKDIFDTAGAITTFGLSAYRERVPEFDAACVRRLREAGAVILGKTNTHEMALGGTTNNTHYGATHNPWDLQRVPGGSSGGSGSALAAGQCLGALGSDTAGSIRIPAAFCGVTGHKPTYGLVSRAGVFALAQTLDHAGPMARSVEDAAIMLNALAGYDAADLDSLASPADDYAGSLSQGVWGRRIAVIPSQLEGCREEVLASFEASLDLLRELGAEVGECEPLAGLGDWRGPMSVSRSIVEAEAAYNVRELLASQPHGFSDAIHVRISAGSRALGTDYIRALEMRKQVERRLEIAMQEWDAIILPTSPDVAEPIAQEVPPADKFRLTSLFDQSRMPAVSIPNGFAEGLPTGVQIGTAKLADGLALSIAHALQCAGEFHKIRPAL